MNWREIGDTTIDAFQQFVAGTPLEPEADSIYTTAQPHSKLILAQAKWETNLAQNQLPAPFNFLGQRPRGGDGFQAYPNFTADAADWHDRITSPTYAYASTVTLEDYVGVYSPDSDNFPGQEAAYVAHIMNVANSLPTLGGPMADPAPQFTMTKGLIPFPSFIDDPIDVAARDQSRNCRGWDDLGPRPIPPKGLVLHRSVNGAGVSNAGYYHATCCPALTDYEVIATTGQGRRFVRPGSRISGWANGPVSAPYGDALAWLDQHNWDLDTVNRDWESCEVTGQYTDPVDDKAWQWLAQWIASRAHDYGITYLTFPLIPAEGNRSYVTWHVEWTKGTGKICPGPVVVNYTSTLLERARSIMKAYQTTGKGTTKPPVKKPYASPDKDVLAFISRDLSRGYPTDFAWKGLDVYALMRPYEVIKKTKRLQVPDPSASPVGPDIDVRTRFLGRYRVVATDAKGTRRGYVLTEWGSWIQESALSPRVSVRKA